MGGAGPVACRATRTACLFAAAHPPPRSWRSLSRLLIGTPDGSCRVAAAEERPIAVSSVEVTATDGSSVTVAWPPSRDNGTSPATASTSNGAQVGTQTPGPGEALARPGLALVHARAAHLRHGLHGRRGCRSIATTATRSVTSTTVSTVGVPRHGGALGADAGCARSRDRELGRARVDAVVGQRRRRRVRALRLGLRVATVSDATRRSRTSLRQELPDRDRRGRRGGQPLRAQTSSYFKTSACPSTNKPPSTPTVVKVTAATRHDVSLSRGLPPRTTSRVTGYGLYLSGVANQRDDRHDRAVHRAQVRHHVRARRRRQRRRRPALGARDTLHRNLTLHTAPPPTDGFDDPDDRERVDGDGCRELVRRLRRATATRSRTTRARSSALSTASLSSPSDVPFGDTPASGRPRRSRTAPTPSRCAPSTAPAPCSPRTPSPRPSPTPQHRPDRRARSRRRSRTVRR